MGVDEAGRRPPSRHPAEAVRLGVGHRRETRTVLLHLPFCAFCRRAMVSPTSPGETHPYFDLAPGESPPSCTPGHHHEAVIWADVKDEDAGLDLP